MVDLHKEPFFETISKGKLIKFNKSHINEGVDADLVEVKLFDIYESPEKIENRIKQKSFWSFSDLNKIISKFWEDNSMDAVQPLKDFLAKNQSRKNK